MERCTAFILHTDDPFREGSQNARLSYGPTGTPTASLAGYVGRRAKQDSGTAICPLVLKDGRWRQKGIPRPRRSTICRLCVSAPMIRSWWWREKRRVTP